MMIRFFLVAFIFMGSLLSVSAQPLPEKFQRDITLQHEIYAFDLPLSKHPEFFREQIIAPPFSDQNDTLCLLPSEVSSNTKERTPSSVESASSEWVLNSAEVRTFLEENIAPKINQPRKDVNIFYDESGNIVFEGAAQEGRRLDIEQTLSLLEKALEEEVTQIQIPLLVTDPVVTVDKKLEEMGVTELLSVGTSDFSGSSRDRIHNVSIGANRFTGTLIAPGEEFSFNHNLGAVDASTGYRREFVILGDRVEKEYGGGLCQVSSTTFRAALLAGLPITERYNHSFAVHYYEPWGSDATIYLGGKDFKFQNNTPGSILIQTSIDESKSQLYFHFYGTKDGRTTRMIGPFLSNYRSIPPSKHEKSTEIPVGTTKWLSQKVRGFDARWERFVDRDGVAVEVQPHYSFSSKYQSRPDWSITGVAALPETTDHKEEG